MKRVQIQLNDDQVAALRRRADASGLAIASLVRQAVDEWIAGQERNQLIERALAAIGGFRSGLGDLSEHHDDYLADIRP